MGGQGQGGQRKAQGGTKKKGPSTEAITEQEREGSGSGGRSGETEEDRRGPRLRGERQKKTMLIMIRT